MSAPPARAPPGMSRAGSAGMPPPSQGPGRAGSTPAGARGSNMSAPPSCPKCELTKSQFGRTLQNYQKAYRKKVESLKTELGATRGKVVQAERKVKQLQSPARVHLPSTAAGMLLGVLAAKYFGQVSKILFKSRRSSRNSAQPPADSSVDEDTDVQHPAESAVASSHPAAPSDGQEHNGHH